MSNNPINQILRIVEENKLSLSNKNGVSIVRVKDQDQGLNLAKNILYNLANRDTVLFLSGGSTPKPLYKLLAKEKKLNAGAVAMVDERYGEPFHKYSNEKMIKETGLLDYFEKSKILFYEILRQDRHSGNQAKPGHPESLYNIRIGADVRDSGVLTSFVPRTTLEKAADDYDKKVKYLLSHFSKRIAIMGIGEDGHVASLRAGIQNSKFKIQNYVIGINDFPGEFKERITLTFKALSKMDLLLVLVFGKKKKSALTNMLKEGHIEEIPARFFKRPDIAKKTIVITDQKV